MAIGIVIANTCIALKLSKRAKTSAWRVLNAMNRIFFKIFHAVNLELFSTLSHQQSKRNLKTRCSGQLISDRMLSFSSTTTDDSHPLNE
jgi:hypothetical protein